MNDAFALQCPVPATLGDAIELAHGSGGRMTQRLVDDLFRPAFADAPGDLTHDGASLQVEGGRLAFTTDSYVVRPLFFPGGDIGTLAVNGTVNDLAMCGAEPLYLSVGLILEEGLAMTDLARVVQSMRAAARAAGVRLVTGDTKVVERGKGDGIYINTSGVGRIVATSPVSPQRVRPGDAVVLSGDIGRHGMAIMAAREGLAFEPPIQSDCAPLAAAVGELLRAGIDVHCLRDPTRGGLATTLNEIALAGGVDIGLDEAAIRVPDPVRGACEILGLDPLYVACEGRFVAIVAADAAAATVSSLQRFDASAAIIGRVEEAGDVPVVRMGTLGGERVLDVLTGEQLPRIC